MAFGGQGFDRLLLERMRMACQIWDVEIRAEFAAKMKPKPHQQFNASKGVSVAVILGQGEVEAGEVGEDCLHAGNGNAAGKDKGQLVSRRNLVEEEKTLVASVILEE